MRAAMQAGLVGTYTVSQLKEWLKHVGLPTDGQKPLLLARVKACLQMRNCIWEYKAAVAPVVAPVAQPPS